MQTEAELRLILPVHADQIGDQLLPLLWPGLKQSFQQFIHQASEVAVRVGSKQAPGQLQVPGGGLDHHHRRLTISAEFSGQVRRRLVRSQGREVERHTSRPQCLQQQVGPGGDQYYDGIRRRLFQQLEQSVGGSGAGMVEPLGIEDEDHPPPPLR